MRMLVQLVKEARVNISGKQYSQIGPGVLVFLAIHKNDEPQTSSWMAQKLTNLRIFPDDQGKMNHTIVQTKGQALVVSQFTLYGDCNKGRRPDFFESASPAFAEKLYNDFLSHLEKILPSVETGKFGSQMDVSLINDGPVTLFLEKI